MHILRKSPLKNAEWLIEDILQKEGFYACALFTVDEINPILTVFGRFFILVFRKKRLSFLQG